MAKKPKTASSFHKWLDDFPERGFTIECPYCEWDMQKSYRGGQENVKGQALDMVALVRTELMDPSSGIVLDRVETLIRMIALEGDDEL